MFDFRILSLNIFDAYLNLEFFRWMNFESNKSSETEMEDEQRDELKASELELLSSSPIEETDEMDETLGSIWDGMPLVGGNLLSNEDWNDEVNE